MNYDERKKLISGWLLETLKRYETPTHMDDNAMRQEMLLMVEDINSECPSTNEGGLRWLLDETAKYVRKNQASRRWPTINMFVKGVRENREKISADLLEKPVELSKGLNVDQINARRIKNREPVPEIYVSGKWAQKLIDQNLITEDDLKPYRN